jgi:hypothetical protein
MPIALSLDVAGHGVVCGRSPPDAQPLSPDQRFAVDLPMDVGAAAVRLQSAVTNGCAIAPNLFLPLQEVGRVQRTDVTEQDAA